MLLSEHETMMEPSVEALYDHTGSKFRLVTLSAKRARQINSYFGALGEGLGAGVPPQVATTARKPLSIAFAEIAADKIVAIEMSDLPPETEPEVADLLPVGPDDSSDGNEGA